ncbi:cupin domain-containing protein [Staphylococcus warneri]|nr:cupin domain-containing protein [Staphylococcus warneri]
MILLKKVNLNDTKKIEHLNGTLQMLLTPKNGGSSNMIMGISNVYPKEIIDKHVHDYSDECFFVLKGSGEIISDSESILFKKNDCVYIPKGTSHKIYNHNDSILTVLFCSSPLAPTNEQGHRKVKEV